MAKKVHITNMGVFTACGRTLSEKNKMFVGVGRIHLYKNACALCLRINEKRKQMLAARAANVKE